MSKFPANTQIMLPAGTFSGKTAFITGGGTGLGKGMAKMLSQLGADVAIASRKLPILEKTAMEITRETGNRVLPVQMDVRDPVAVKEAIDYVTKELGLPTIIINNAAGNFISPFERLSPNAFKTIVDIVLNGTANVTLDLGKRLIKEGKGGVFLAITTSYAQDGSGYVVPSACAKSGVDAMTKSLSSEWAKYGMRFNVIAPGPFITEGAFSRLDPTGEFQKKEGNANIPVNRFGEIEELANLVAYLVSDYGNFMNGEIICFDGGQRRSRGQFSRLEGMTGEQWDKMEQMIRANNKKSKL